MLFHPMYGWHCVTASLRRIRKPISNGTLSRKKRSQKAAMGSPLAAFQLAAAPFFPLYGAGKTGAQKGDRTTLGRRCYHAERVYPLRSRREVLGALPQMHPSRLLRQLSGGERYSGVPLPSKSFSGRFRCSYPGARQPPSLSVTGGKIQHG